MSTAATTGGRRVVVTGAASGIGAATARLFHEKGNAVVGIDLKVPPNGAWPVLAANMAVVEETKTAISQAAASMGGIDVLVYCAGVTERGSVEDTTPEVWDSVFDVNVRGAYVCARAALPHLRQNPSAAIVNVASQFAFMVNRQYAAYWGQNKSSAKSYAKGERNMNYVGSRMLGLRSLWIGAVWHRFWFLCPSDSTTLPADWSWGVGQWQNGSF